MMMIGEALLFPVAPPPPAWGGIGVPVSDQPPAPAPAMTEEGKVAGGVCAPTPKRRSPRLTRKKELSACASEQDLILQLKREMKALRELRKERLAREGLLDEYMAGWEAAARKYPKASEENQPPVIAGTKRRRTVEEETQKAGKTKRKKVVKSRVPQKFIEYIILNRRKPFEGICEETEVGKRSQRFRELYAERVAVANKRLEYEGVLIKQFRTKGYADDYEEVTDNEEN